MPKRAARAREKTEAEDRMWKHAVATQSWLAPSLSFECHGHKHQRNGAEAPYLQGNRRIADDLGAAGATGVCIAVSREFGYRSTLSSAATGLIESGTESVGDTARVKLANRQT